MIKKLFMLIHGNIRFLFLKLIHFKSFKYSPYCNLNLGNEIELKNNGKISLGKKFIMRKNCRLSANGGTITIGNNSGFNNNCYVVSHKKIIIGNNVEIGPNSIIVDHDHDFKKEFLNCGKKRLFNSADIIIGNNVWIGANVVILKGTIIGNNCVIAAGSIIKGIISENTLVFQKKENCIKKIEY